MPRPRKKTTASTAKDTVNLRVIERCVEMIAVDLNTLADALADLPSVAIKVLPVPSGQPGLTWVGPICADDRPVPEGATSTVNVRVIAECLGQVAGDLNAIVAGLRTLPPIEFKTPIRPPRRALPWVGPPCWPLPPTMQAAPGKQPG